MIKHVILPGVAVVALATCASAPNTAFYTRDLCEAHSVKTPDGVCSAQYKQYFDVETSTQVSIACQAAGLSHMSGLIGYAGHAAHGVQLRWLSSDELEIATPDIVEDHPIEMRWLADDTVKGVWTSGKTRIMDGPKMTDAADEAPPTALRTVHIHYRALTPKDGEWKHSCYSKRPKAKAP